MNTSIKILILDDDQKLCDLISRFLNSRGFAVSSIHHGDDLIEKIYRVNPDLLLLDVMLPGDDGFEILKKIRKKSNIPVIMLTARGDTTDRIVGLQLGADDYLPKPFEPAELDVRIKAVLRRTMGNLSKIAGDTELTSDKLKFGQYELDTRQRKIIGLNLEIELTSMEYRLLEYLIHNANQVITRGQLTEALYGDDFDPYRRSIDILISRLRKKVEKTPEKPCYIKTLHGQGYLFDKTSHAQGNKK